MKMSVQERVILIIFVMVLISALGIFWFVVPEVQKIQSSNITREAKQKELKEAEEKAATKDAIKQSIVTAYEESQTLSELFFEKMDTVEADIITRKFIQDLGFISSYSLALSEYDTETLEITSQPSEDDKDEKEKKIEATVGVNIVTFDVTLAADRFYDLLDAINDYKVMVNGKQIRKAIYLNGFSEPTVKEGEEFVVYTLTLRYFSIERVEIVELENSQPETNDEVEV